MTDWYIYNGDIERGRDLEFINLVCSQQESENCILVLVTSGGNPDAAYKIARYLQQKYNSYSVSISGFCKSAGTLLAIGAKELIFTPYGELGPLDVQMTKKDQIAALESGLNISEAFTMLEERARGTYHKLIGEIIVSSEGVVSFATASHAASEIVSSLYGPIFGSIDPEEVGSRYRAMRIGADYGKRLNMKWGNLKEKALDELARTYSSHGFVIDMLEAETLFEKVRSTTDEEMIVIESLNKLARYPKSRDLVIEKLDLDKIEFKTGETNVGKSAKKQTRQSAEKTDGRNSKGTRKTRSKETIRRGTS